MKELSATARAWLERADLADTPDAAARNRVERAVAQRIVTGAALGASTSALNKYASAAGSATSNGAMVKAFGIVAVGAVVAAGGYGWLTPKPKLDASEVAEHSSNTASPAEVRSASSRSAASEDALRGSETAHEAEPHSKGPTALDSAPSHGAHPGAARSSQPHPAGHRTIVPIEPEPEPEPERSHGARPSQQSHTSRRTRPKSLPPAQRTGRAQDVRHGETSVSAADASEAPRRTAGQSRRAERPDRAAPQRTTASEELSRKTHNRLEAEARQLRRVQRALRSGDGRRALHLLREAAEEFRDGALHQERAAARIQALCLIGSEQAAHAEATAFERRWPRSPLLARVRSACR